MHRSKKYLVLYNDVVIISDEGRPVKCRCFYLIQDCESIQLTEGTTMRNTVIALCLLMIVGCRTPAHTPPVSRLDSAIENLSFTTEQLESVRKEKDFFVKMLEDFEEQKAEYGPLLNANHLRSQMQDFADWHRDISQQERQLEIQHALNVFAAHSQVAKRKAADPNQASLVSLPTRKP
jgi:hypothetical protein